MAKKESVSIVKGKNSGEERKTQGSRDGAKGS